MNIYIDFLGDPSVKLDNQLIDFPYKKAAALFFYMVLNPKASRESLVALFWSDFDDASAKKNLRDALYKVKKAFNFDVLISPSKSYICLNPDYHFVSDVHQFQNNPSLKLYKGLFLKNFFIKECYGFEEWTSNVRHHLHQIYVDLVRKNLYVAFQENAIRQIEKYADIIIKEDPYNEKILRDIMKQYSLNGYYNKALGIYYQLANILSTELDISPETSTTALFKEIVEIRSSDQPLTSPNPKFIGRTKELSCLMTGFEGLMKGQRKSFFISGEVGLGKTHLLQILSDSIKNYDCYILQSNCHETDKDFFLQPWDYIFKQVHQILIK